MAHLVASSRSRVSEHSAVIALQVQQRRHRGWFAFSQQEYAETESRRHLLGTLVRHSAGGLLTVEFAPGDAITPRQIEQAYFTVVEHVEDAAAWSVRPPDPSQVTRMLELDGRLPIVDRNAPFRGLSFQPLTAGVAYGTLCYVRADQLETAALGPHDIVVTDLVPNDIPMVAGLITESFQTPLAHVNVLSRGRGTPNMALQHAHQDPRFVGLWDQLVRLEVGGAHFTVAAADPDEAVAFGDARTSSGPPLSPRLDTSVRRLRSLSEAGIAELPSLGAKAAQLGELGRVELCSDSASVPHPAVAIPLVHSREHYEASGSARLLNDLQAQASFAADPEVCSAGLQRVRDLTATHPVDPELLTEVLAAIATHWPDQPIRFRSSSNAEDLAGFNGAGLYASVGEPAHASAPVVEEALRAVWASLWNLRAYDERAHFNLDQDAVAMAVLIHQAFKSERANGVVISRDILDPVRADRYYFNVQVGEALVTNPVPGTTSEQFTFDPHSQPEIQYQTRSSLVREGSVLSAAEAELVACNLQAIHAHFRPLLDPANENSWFAMDVEFKLVGSERALVFKQARPYSFGDEAPTGWCDF